MVFPGSPARMTIFSGCMISDTALCFGGLGEVAAETCIDYALLKGPECTRDECLLVKERLKSSGAVGFFF